VDLSEVIEQRLVADSPVGGDVTEEALRRGWVLPFAEGQYVYGAEWTSLVRRLQELLLARASDLGFREYLFPRLIPSEAVRDFQLSQFKPRPLWNLDDDAKVLDSACPSTTFSEAADSARTGYPCQARSQERNRGD
jgi:hypothetical protein